MPFNYLKSSSQIYPPKGGGISQAVTSLNNLINNVDIVAQGTLALKVEGQLIYLSGKAIEEIYNEFVENNYFTSVFNSTGVKDVNGATGSVDVEGLGGITVTTVGNTIYISGHNEEEGGAEGGTSFTCSALESCDKVVFTTGEQKIPGMKTFQGVQRFASCAQKPVVYWNDVDGLNTVSGNIVGGQNIVQSSYISGGYGFTGKPPISDEQYICLELKDITGDNGEVISQYYSYECPEDERLSGLSYALGLDGPYSHGATCDPRIIIGDGPAISGVEVTSSGIWIHGKAVDTDVAMGKSIGGGEPIYLGNTDKYGGFCDVKPTVLHDTSNPNWKQEFYNEELEFATLQGTGGLAILKDPANCGRILISGGKTLENELTQSDWGRNIVYTTGNQIISGNKTFADDVEVGEGGDWVLQVENNTVGVDGILDVTGMIYLNGHPITGTVSVYEYNNNTIHSGSVFTSINGETGKICLSGSNGIEVISHKPYGTGCDTLYEIRGGGAGTPGAPGAAARAGYWTKTGTPGSLYYESGDVSVGGTPVISDKTIFFVNSGGTTIQHAPLIVSEGTTGFIETRMLVGRSKIPNFVGATYGRRIPNAQIYSGISITEDHINVHGSQGLNIHSTAMHVKGFDEKRDPWTWQGVSVYNDKILISGVPVKTGSAYGVSTNDAKKNVFKSNSLAKSRDYLNSPNELTFKYLDTTGTAVSIFDKGDYLLFSGSAKNLEGQGAVTIIEGEDTWYVSGREIHGVGGLKVYPSGDYYVISGAATTPETGNFVTRDMTGHAAGGGSSDTGNYVTRDMTGNLGGDNTYNNYTLTGVVGVSSIEGLTGAVDVKGQGSVTIIANSSAEPEVLIISGSPHLETSDIDRVISNTHYVETVNGLSGVVEVSGLAGIDVATGEYGQVITANLDISGVGFTIIYPPHPSSKDYLYGKITTGNGGATDPRSTGYHYLDDNPNVVVISGDFVSASDTGNLVSRSWTGDHVNKAWLTSKTGNLVTKPELLAALSDTGNFVTKPELQQRIEDTVTGDSTIDLLDDIFVSHLEAGNLVSGGAGIDVRKRLAGPHTNFTVDVDITGLYPITTVYPSRYQIVSADRSGDKHIYKDLIDGGSNGITGNDGTYIGTGWHILHDNPNTVMISGHDLMSRSHLQSDVEQLTGCLSISVCDTGNFVTTSTTGCLNLQLCNTGNYATLSDIGSKGGGGSITSINGETGAFVLEGAGAVSVSLSAGATNTITISGSDATGNFVTKAELTDALTGILNETGNDGRKDCLDVQLCNTGDYATLSDITSSASLSAFNDDGTTITPLGTSVTGIKFGIGLNAVNINPNYIHVEGATGVEFLAYDEGSKVGKYSHINFKGAGVTAQQNSIVGEILDVVVPAVGGGGGGAGVQELNSLTGLVEIVSSGTADDHVYRIDVSTDASQNPKAIILGGLPTGEWLSASGILKRDFLPRNETGRFLDEPKFNDLFDFYPITNPSGFVTYDRFRGTDGIEVGYTPQKASYFGDITYVVTISGGQLASGIEYARQRFNELVGNNPSKIDANGWANRKALPENIVFTTGRQSIVGHKEFQESTRPTVMVSPRSDNDFAVETGVPLIISGENYWTCTGYPESALSADPIVIDWDKAETHTMLISNHTNIVFKNHLKYPGRQINVLLRNNGVLGGDSHSFTVDWPNYVQWPHGEQPNFGEQGDGRWSVYSFFGMNTNPAMGVTSDCTGVLGAVSLQMYSNYI